MREEGGGRLGRRGGEIMANVSHHDVVRHMTFSKLKTVIRVDVPSVMKLSAWGVKVWGVWKEWFLTP